MMSITHIYDIGILIYHASRAVTPVSVTVAADLYKLLLSYIYTHRAATRAAAHFVFRLIPG